MLPGVTRCYPVYLHSYHNGRRQVRISVRLLAYILLLLDQKYMKVDRFRFRTRVWDFNSHEAFKFLDFSVVSPPRAEVPIQGY